MFVISIRDDYSLVYINEDRDCTYDAKEAVKFNTRQEALDFIKKHQLKNVSIKKLDY